jgi:uncharacterized delta-60 repeat protein
MRSRGKRLRKATGRVADELFNGLVGRIAGGFAEKASPGRDSFWLAEPLERRLLFTASLIGGASSVNEGSPYTLNLNTVSQAGASWSINWGDGSSAQTVPGTATSATHVYTTPAQDTITATVSGLTNPLDTTFGSGGVDQNDLGSSGEEAQDTVIQPDGKILVAGGPGFLVARYNTNGTLDTSFGTGGVVSITGIDSAYSIALQSNGQILVGGGTGFNVARLNSNGTLDTTFGSGGLVKSNLGSNFVAYDMSIDSSGRIWLVGTTGNNIEVARYTSSGVLDTTYSGNGHTSFSVSGNTSQALACCFQSDGKLLIVGDTTNVTDTQIVLLRLTASGSLDTTFGSGGMVITNPTSGQEDVGSDVAEQSNGQIIVTGRAGTGSAANLLVMRYNSNGTLDSTFGTSGKTTVDWDGERDLGKAVRILSNGQILVAGRVTLSDDQGIGLVRFNSDGSLDTTFGSNGGAGGKVYTDLTSGNDYANGMAIDANGEAVVAGSANDTQFAVARYWLTSTGTTTVTVNDVAPAVQAEASFPGIVANSLFHIPLATFTDPYANNSTLTATINWGDGTASAPDITPGTIENVNGVNQVAATHGYALAGNYPITVTVTDSHNASGSVTQTLAVAPPPGPFTVPGPIGTSTTLTFTVTDEPYSANYHNELGFFEADDGTFDVNGIAPGASGYTTAALTQQANPVVFAPETPFGTTYSITLPAGKLLDFFIVQDDTVGGYLATPSTFSQPEYQNNGNHGGTGGIGGTGAVPNVFFMNAPANADGFQHFVQYANGIYGVEDQYGGGDEDFNDVVFSLSAVNNINLTATASSNNTSINLNWIGGPTASGYELQRELTTGGTWADVAGASDLTATSFTDTTAATGVSYSYRVNPVGAGASGWSNVAAAKLPGVITITPPGSAIIGTAGSPTTVTMSFTDTDPAATHTGTINWGDGTTGDPDITPVTVTEPSGSTPGTFTDNQTYTTPGTYAATLTTTSSDGITTTTPFTVTISAPSPAAPVLTAADTIENTSIDLNWTESATGISGYLIEREPAGGSFSPLATITDPTTTSYQDFSAVAGVIYSYEMEAYETVGGVQYFGGFSNTAIASLSDALPPKFVTETTATVSADGKTIVLATYGADALGESGLNYTWTATSIPQGAAAPVFTENGNNAAKNTTATISANGRYTFAVTMIDTAGLGAVSAAYMTVGQVITAIALTPSTAALLPGATQQFLASATDQFGNPMLYQPTFDWSVGDPDMGTIASAGLFTAGTTCGTEAVEASAGGISATATLTVSQISSTEPLAAAALDSSDIEVYWLDLPALSNGATLEESEDSTFATGVTSVNIPADTTTYAFSGLSAATTYYFELLAASGSAVLGTASATTPAASIGGGGGTSNPIAPVITQQATDTEVDDSDYSLTMTASCDDPVDYSWQLISSTGDGQAPDFTADAQTTTAEFYAAGTYVFLGTATDASTGLSAPSDVTVTVSQVLSNIQFSFGSPTIMSGTTDQFAATGLDQFGNAMTTQPPFNWSASGDGSIDSATGLYTAPPGGSEADTPAAITVSSGAVTSTADITIAPSDVYIGNDGLVYVQATDVDQVKVFTTSGSLVKTLPFNGPFPQGLSFRGPEDIELADGTYLDASRSYPYPLVREDAAGNVIQTYLSYCPDVYWTGMALDPDGKSFWVCDESCDVYEFNIATGAQEEFFYASGDLGELGVETNSLGIKLGDGSTNQALQTSSDGTQNLVPLQFYLPSDLQSGTSVTLTADAPGGMDLWNSANPASGSTPLDSGDGWTYTFPAGQQVPSELWVGATGPSITDGDITFTLALASGTGSSTQPATTSPATAPLYLAWNTDHVDGLLHGFSIDTNIADGSPNEVFNATVALGGSGITVNWGDGSTPDDGSEPHFYSDSETPYTVTVTDDRTGTPRTTTFSVTVDDPAPSADEQTPAPADTGCYLGWQAVDDASSYSIYQSNDSAGGGTLLATVASPGYAIPDGGEGSYYSIVANLSDGTEDQFSSVLASPLGAAAAPTSQPSNPPPLITYGPGVTPGEYDALAIADLRKQYAADPRNANNTLVGLFNVKITQSGNRTNWIGDFTKLTNVTKDANGNLVTQGGYAGAKSILLAMAGQQNTGVQDLGNGNLQVNLQDGGTIQLTKDGDWAEMAINPSLGAPYTVTWENPVVETDFRTVGGGKNGNIDAADFISGTIFEDKTGVDLLNKWNLVDPTAADPKTAAKKNSESNWAQVRIFDATKSRLLALQQPGQETYPLAGKYVGPAQPPPITQYQAIKNVVVRFVGPPASYAGWTAFINAVQTQVAALNADPQLQAFGYHFSIQGLP